MTTPDHPTTEPEDRAGEVTVPALSAPRERLVSTFTGRPSWVQYLVAVLLAALGFAAVTQVRINNNDDEFLNSRRQDLVVLLDSLAQSNDRVRDQIDDLTQKRASLSDEKTQRHAVLKRSKRTLDALGILSGTTAAQGPGVKIVISGPAGSVTAATVLDALEELRDAGAEAIEINDRVRIVASTAVTETNGVLYVDKVAISTPYVLDAIGSAHTLAEAVTFRGGLSDQVRAVGGRVELTSYTTLRVTSLHKVTPPQYSHPAR